MLDFEVIVYEMLYTFFLRALPMVVEYATFCKSTNDSMSRLGKCLSKPA